MTNLSIFHSRKVAAFLTLTLVSGHLAMETLPAATIQGGSLTLGFDQTGFALVGLTNINSFDQATSNSLTATEIQTDSGTTTSWSNIVYGINPTTGLIDPTGRNLQETTFTYNPADLTGTAAGQIGIGGTTRWDVNPLLGGGVFVLGDYSFQYDSARAGGIYSGWYLTNNFGFPAVAFDFANVTTNVLGEGFTLSGDLYVKAASPLTFFGFSSDTDYGNFSLNASTVPEPSSIALIVLGAAACYARRRRPTLI